METRSKCLACGGYLSCPPSILSLGALSAQHLNGAWPSPKPKLPCLVLSLEDDLLVIRSCYMGFSPEHSCLPLLTTPLPILAGSLKKLAGRGRGKGGRVGQEGNVTTGIPLN